MADSKGATGLWGWDMCLVVAGFKHWPFSVYILDGRAVLQFTFLDACTKTGKQCIKISHVLILLVTWK